MNRVAGGGAGKEAHTVQTININFPAAVLCRSLSHFLLR
jgi:hypothetical protein